MKISHHTPDLLILDDIPWVMGIMMSVFTLTFVGPGLYQVIDGDMTGFWMILAGLGIFALGFFGFVRRTQVVFNRETGLVRLRSRTLRGYREQVFDLSDVSRARLQAHYSDNSKTYRLAIEITEGPNQGVHPTTPVYTSGKGPHEAEAAINMWLNNRL